MPRRAAGGRDGKAHFEDMPKVTSAANVSIRVGSWAQVPSGLGLGFGTLCAQYAYCSQLLPVDAKE